MKRPTKDLRWEMEQPGLRYAKKKNYRFNDWRPDIEYKNTELLSIAWDEADDLI